MKGSGLGLKCSRRLRLSVAGALAAVILIAGCSQSRQVKTGDGAPDVSPSLSTPPPGIRLGNQADPTAYELKLVVDPAREDFFGQVTIHLTFNEPTSTLWLNAKDLKILKAELSQSGAVLTATAVVGDEERIGLRFGRPATVGPASVFIEYTGKVTGENDYQGLFRRQVDGTWYLYSHMEPLYARRVVPCFDDPVHKTPWDLALQVPKGLVALSNTPLEKTEEADDGSQLVRFATTRPLPTYLLAFAVGPFELIELDEQKSLRVVVPKGQSARCKFACQVAPRALALLETWFGEPQPFAKLDLVAVPGIPFSMENPGLIIFSEGILLADEDELTLGAKQATVSTVAHEMAHLWFGDLVTPAWWDDVWLNESLATWMHAKILAQYDSVLGERSLNEQRESAMHGDSLVNATAIRKEVKTRDDVLGAFDSAIAYDKGALVVRMIERWAGEDAFRKMIRSYVDKHRWGTVTRTDFESSLESALGAPAVSILRSFSGQRGVPLVSVDLQCKPDEPPSLLLSQKRLVRLGSEADEGAAWHLPVCARAGLGAKQVTACTCLSDRSGSLPLSGLDPCPDWVFVNAGLQGYFRVSTSGDLLGRMRRHLDTLSTSEKTGLLGDLWTAAKSGAATIPQVLALCAALSADRDPLVAAAALEPIGQIADWLVDDDLQPAYRLFMRTTFGERAKSMGWTAKEGEPETVQALRSRLMRLIAVQARDETQAKQADLLARSWLQDRTALQAEMVGTVLLAAARYGNSDLFDRILEATRKERSQRTRQRLLEALGAFRQEDLALRARELVLDPALPFRDSLWLIVAQLSEPETRPAAIRFFEDHFEEIQQKVPQDQRRFLLQIAGSFCDPVSKRSYEAFYGPRAENITEGKTTFAKVNERISQCISMRAAFREDLAAFLKKH